MEGASSESPARDKHLCPVCKAEFAFESSQRKHVRKQHPEAESSLAGRKVSYDCDLCFDVFSHRGELLQHHEQSHGFVSRRSTVEFTCYADFAAWKEVEEKKEQVQFIAASGPKRLSSGAVKKYLVCHRSGVPVKTGQGKRQTKLVGSVKRSKHCLATMAVTQEGEKITVDYQAEHYGHEKRATHQRLTATEVSAQQLVPKVKSKAGHRITDCFKSHQAGVALSESGVSKEPGGCWLVESQSLQDYRYTVVKGSTVCKGCRRSCQDCNVCIHSLQCMCLDYKLHLNLCKHIHAVVHWEQRRNLSVQDPVDDQGPVPLTSAENCSFPLAEPQALLCSIQADQIIEPQNSDMEDVRTQVAALLQDAMNKDDSADPTLVELLKKTVNKARQVVKQFPDRQPSVLQPSAPNK